MRPTVLVAAPGTTARRIAAHLRDHVTVVIASELERALVLVANGDFGAVVTTPGFLPDAQRERCVVADRPDDPGIIDTVMAAATRRKANERDEARELAGLAVLPYDEFIELVRGRETRRYLLALLHRHRGSVTAAANAAGIKRESLHRLLRRYELDADVFRQ